MPVGQPARHWVFERKLEVGIPSRYVLEIDGGTVVGEYGANVTPGRTLDHQTSEYFGVTDWREHPIFLSPRLPRATEVPGTLLNLTSCGTTSNYYHFLFDSLPRFGIFEECFPGRPVDGVVVPHAARYQRELLQLIGVEGPWLQPARQRAFHADTVLVPSTPNQHLDCPPWITEWLRRRLPPTRTDGPRRLYLTRGDRPNTRRYVNEGTLWPALEKLGFYRLDPGTLSVQEQINYFSRAEVIVSPHGAALTNLVFARPDVRVLELFANDYVHLGLWAIAAAMGESTYHYLVAEGGHPEGKPMTGIYSDVDIPVERVLAALDGLLSDVPAPTFPGPGVRGR
jgi:capsular polysaccharide biosynthesis protein